MKKSHLDTLIIVGLLLVIGGGWLIAKQFLRTPAPPGQLRTVTEFHDDKPLPDFTLSGPKGEFTQKDLLGEWSFVFFGYTQCPDVCPTALTLMRSLKTQLSAVSPALSFRTVFISVDPQRDTRELLDQYIAAFDPTFVGLRGDDAALQPLIKNLGVFFRRNDGTDKSHYTVDHSAGIYLIDPQGRLAAVFSPPQRLEAMAADFQRIAKAR